ncbi:hypothetical protein Hypma_010583 [Hypsizygus marmoreus]|uniref:Transcription factor TFIIIC triple barrel domain-containing protein n=1 Tax=Hypsizygus marmoreus TaxID=39966 RepID=A0A369JNN8_HYPMA|nr:hypothetical protein Hypma_010583 [Hypsizygus marmoreus]
MLLELNTAETYAHLMLNSSSSLCPGYKQVESFGPDDEYEDEEVTYVTLDLGSIEPSLVPSSSTYRLIGLDTPTPFLQLSGTILKGRHDTLLGTELLFTDGKDQTDRAKRAVTHVANTEQRVCFREVRLVPKGTDTVVAANGKGKGKAKDVEEEPVAEAAQLVDRVTGKNAPRARAPRVSRGKEATKSTRQTRGSAKAKGKRKAVEEDEDEDEEEEEPPDEDVEGDDMDIYED